MLGICVYKAFAKYVHGFTHPIMQIANISNILQRTATAADGSSPFWMKRKKWEESTSRLLNQLAISERIELRPRELMDSLIHGKPVVKRLFGPR